MEGRGTSETNAVGEVISVQTFANYKLNRSVYVLYLMYKCTYIRGVRLPDTHLFSGWERKACRSIDAMEWRYSLFLLNALGYLNETRTYVCTTCVVFAWFSNKPGIIYIRSRGQRRGRGGTTVRHACVYICSRGGGDGEERLRYVGRRRRRRNARFDWGQSQAAEAAGRKCWIVRDTWVGVLEAGQRWSFVVPEFIREALACF